jgi:hypothetical protein
VRNNTLEQPLSKAQKDVKLKFTPEQATKLQRGSRYIAAVT